MSPIPVWVLFCEAQADADTVKVLVDELWDTDDDPVGRREGREQAIQHGTRPPDGVQDLVALA